MSTASSTLVDCINEYRPYERARADLEPLWLAAANERLAQQRERIPVLGRLADEQGIHEIRTLDDLVPLLFAHSNYKSYPATLIAKNRWDLMNRWLDTLSSVRVEGVDVDGVTDQDEWIERLHAAGHMVFATSGTSGKNSFLPATPFDRDFSMRALLPMITWVQRTRAEARSRRVHPRPEVRAQPGGAVLPRSSPRRSADPMPGSSSPTSRCEFRDISRMAAIRRRDRRRHGEAERDRRRSRKRPGRARPTWRSASTS